MAAPVIEGGYVPYQDEYEVAPSQRVPQPEAAVLGALQKALQEFNHHHPCPQTAASKRVSLINLTRGGSSMPSEPTYTQLDVSRMPCRIPYSVHEGPKAPSAARGGCGDKVGGADCAHCCDVTTPDDYYAPFPSLFIPGEPRRISSGCEWRGRKNLREQGQVALPSPPTNSGFVIQPEAIVPPHIPTV